MAFELSTLRSVAAYTLFFIVKYAEYSYFSPESRLKLFL